MKPWFLLAGVAACGTPSTHAVSNHEPDKGITVRMARDGEFAAKPSEWPECRVDGALARELYEPVVAFARANLVSLLARDAATPIRSQLTFPGVTADRSQAGIEIVVEPRTNVGQLLVSYWRGDQGGDSFRYCLNVLREHGGTTVVVEHFSRTVGARSSRRAGIADAR